MTTKFGQRHKCGTLTRKEFIRGIDIIIIIIIIIIIRAQGVWER
jgi:hypothetical protein